jgi:hypothetical protein
MSPLKLSKIIVDLPRPTLADIPASIQSQFASAPIDLKPNASVAVAVGSRGIANLSVIVKCVIDQLKARNTLPFIVPAMGSHGGATTEGQRDVLAAYDITESNMGCPVRSSMEVVELDSSGLDNSAYMDRNAYKADGIVVINRIKPHTDFHGPYESGLVKMIVIGLGKERQAYEMHCHGVYGLKELVPKTAERILNLGKITLGIGIVENAYDETAKVEVIPGSQILDREAELIKEAHTNLPQLPVSEVDILGVDQLGKDMSGTGLDTNVIGRIRIPTETEPSSPTIKAIYVSDLTPASHGNATGMGLADVITEQFRSRIDYGITYTNIVTSGFLERAKQPIVAQSDQAAFELCHRAVGPIPLEQLRVIRIQDTLHVNELYVSSSILEEIKTEPNVSIITKANDAFDSVGKSIPF